MELDFKELDFKELEIHRYSLMDTINEFIDGNPSMNMVPFLWFPFFGPFFGAFPLGPMGPAVRDDKS